MRDRGKSDKYRTLFVCSACTLAVIKSRSDIFEVSGTGFDPPKLERARGFRFVLVRLEDDVIDCREDPPRGVDDEPI
jgi:hypothetical protein